MVISNSTICRTTQRLELTKKKTLTLLTSNGWSNWGSIAETVCEEWDKTELIRGHALISQKLMGQGKRFSALTSMST